MYGRRDIYGAKNAMVQQAMSENHLEAISEEVFGDIFPFSSIPVPAFISSRLPGRSKEREMAPAVPPVSSFEYMDAFVNRLRPVTIGEPQVYNNTVRVVVSKFDWAKTIKLASTAAKHSGVAMQLTLIDTDLTDDRIPLSFEFVSYRR